MIMPKTELISEIAEDYYLSNSVKFGEFELSAHKIDPSLPLSPWYLHYPRSDEEGFDYLPEMYTKIGQAFFELAESLGLSDGDNILISPIPNGSTPLGKEFARHYHSYPDNLLSFDKTIGVKGEAIFSGPSEVFELNEEAIPIDDHISGATNNRRFINTARKQGLIVRSSFCVVDREQGGAENLNAIDVTLHSLMTASFLLRHGVENGHINQATATDVIKYQRENKIV